MMIEPITASFLGWHHNIPVAGPSASHYNNEGADDAATMSSLSSKDLNWSRYADVSSEETKSLDLSCSVSFRSPKIKSFA